MWDFSLGKKGFYKEWKKGEVMVVVVGNWELVLLGLLLLLALFRTLGGVGGDCCGCGAH